MRFIRKGLCEKNANFLSITAAGVCSYHLDMKG